MRRSVSVLGALVVPAALAGCGSSEPSLLAHPTPSVHRSPSPTSSADPDGGRLGADPVRSVTKTGRLLTVTGNDPSTHCLAIETSSGAYVVATSTKSLDVFVSEANGAVQPRRTGIHRHGRPSSEMLHVLGDRVTITGDLDSTNTDVECSRYYTIGLTSVR